MACNLSKFLAIVSNIIGMRRNNPIKESMFCMQLSNYLQAFLLISQTANAKILANNLPSVSSNKALCAKNNADRQNCDTILSCHRKIVFSLEAIAIDNGLVILLFEKHTEYKTTKSVYNEHLLLLQFGESVEFITNFCK